MPTAPTSPRPRSAATAYLVSLLAVAASLVLRWWLAPWLEPGLPFVTVFGAVALAVWWGGVGPAVFAAVIGFVASAWLFLPAWRAGPTGAEMAVTIGSYAFSTGLIIAFGGSLLRVRRSLQGKVQECLVAEAAAASERERLRITLACIGDGVIVCDQHGDVVTVNPSAQAMTGWTQDAAAGQPMTRVFDIVNEHTGETVGNPGLRALHEGTVVGLANHTVLRPRQGEPIPIEDSAAPIVDAAGERVGAVLVFRDVREQRAAERKLIEAHEALEVVVQSSPLAVVVLDTEPPLVRLWNGAAERVFGWKAAQVLNRPLPIVPADRSHEARRFEEQVRAGATLPDVETFRQRVDGTLVDVRMSAAPLRDAQGAITGILMLFADVTDRVRAEVSLRQSEATLRAFFDNAPFCLGVVELTPDGDVLHLDDNPRTSAVFGLPPGATAGRLASELGASAGLVAMWRERYQQSASIDGPVEFQYLHPLHPLQGVQRRFRAIVCPIGWGPGGRVRYCYIAEDITQRHLAEARLLESEASARLALQVARLGAWSWNARTHEFTGDVRMREICGLDPNARLSLRDLLRRLHPEDRPGVKRSLAAATRGAAGTDDGAHEGEYAQEFRLVHPGGEVRWVVARGQALFDVEAAVASGTAGAAAVANVAGRTAPPVTRHFTRMFGSLLDITERKRNEETLALADRRKDEFLATLAHELRNPLAPLRNGVHLLRIIAGDSPAADRPLSIMERQISHMVRLIDDLLDVSRVSGSKLQLQRHRVDLAQVVREAIETSQPQLDAAGHEVFVALPEQTVQVDADPTRLCQVIANLLNNAAKYTPRAGRVRISVEPRADVVDVVVEDDGLGIPAEMLPRIFDMFTQVDQSLERSQGGLGIGLAIAKRLVEMHGGTLRAYSAGAGSGSRFVVSLPIAHMAPAPLGATAAEGAEPAAPAGVGRRVLVADDNADSADSLVALLRLMGHEARLARDGQEAYEMAESYRPEIALLDIGMPRLNGYELARRLREMPWGRTIQLVAVTGWGQDADRKLSEAAGFDLHLVKPVDPQALAAVVEGPQGQR